MVSPAGLRPSPGEPATRQQHGRRNSRSWCIQKHTHGFLKYSGRPAVGENARPSLCGKVGTHRHPKTPSLPFSSTSFRSVRKSQREIWKPVQK